MKVRSLRRALLVSSACCALASAAAAQDAAGVEEVPAAQADAGKAEGGDDLVVTGSRVITNGNNSPTPVTVVGIGELARTTPSNVSDGLNKLPQFNNSSNQRSIGTPSFNAVGNYLNIRGIGPVRTLVLFDGRRLPSTNSGGQVDANIIPQFLLERVDVVTGGASAVYGSDAVSGVVNFIVDKKFDGIKALAQGGISTYGDAGSQRLAIAGGTPFAGGRGHVEASYEYYNSASIPSREARPLGRMEWGLQGGGTAANPFHLVPHVRYGNFAPGGYVRTGPAAGFHFVGDGALVPFRHGAPTGTANIESGGDGSVIIGAMTASLRTHQAFARLDYELDDDIEAYAQGAATRIASSYDFAQPNFNGFTFATDNAFLSPAAQAALSAGGATTFVVGKRLDNRMYVMDIDTDSYVATAGLKGRLGTAFSWDVSYTRSQAIQRGEVPENINTERFTAAIDAVRDGSGAIVCRVTQTNPGRLPGCVPFNPFGLATDSDAAWDYVTDPTRYRLRDRMDDVLASISGSPFSTWAGPVQMALSGEYRDMSLVNVSNAEPSAVPDCTGIRYNCVGSLIYRTNIVASGSGKQRIVEGALEANVPLVRDVALIRELNVNGAVRYADYSTSGGATTWKVGIDWQVSEELRLRGTRSRDIRAPNLNDLFGPETTSPSGFSDLHTGISGALLLTTRSNPNLRPEVANTLTGGLVYRPSFAPGLSASIDYYQIRIGNAIAAVASGDANVQRLCEDSDGTSPFCALYVRPLPFADRSAANYPTRIINEAANIALFDQAGVDVELGYRSAVGDGTLNLRGLASYTIRQNTRSLPTSPVIEWAGVGGHPPVNFGLGTPKTRITAIVEYRNPMGALTVQERWRSRLKLNGDPTLVYSDPPLPSIAYTDVTLAITPSGAGRSEFFVSVENLFDQQPSPFMVNTFSSVPGYYYAAPGGDDVIGRYVTAGVRMRW